METAKFKCSDCGQWFQARNFGRHRKACLKKRRELKSKQQSEWLERFRADSDRVKKLAELWKHKDAHGV